MVASCMECGKELTKNQKKYCSHSCQMTDSHRRRREAQPPRYCQACGVKLDVSDKRRRFCSHSCAAKQNNLGRVHNPPTPHNICARCGAPVEAPDRKYCQACIYAKHHDFAEARTPDFRKKILIEERGWRCEDCGGTEWTRGRKIPLELHHVDGNSANNDAGNLVLLCSNCHALTPTYKGKNRRRGRGSIKNG